LDEIQAAVLSVKLKYLDDDNARRQAIADYYIKHVKNPLLRLPEPSGSVFHVFPVLCEQRDRLQQYLAENGVATVVHYPIPPHKQACYEKWHDICLPITEQIHAQELSIPCHQAMTSGEVETVTDIINRFTN
jgi:dTDP-4-amino-4,6-dideoxygalactose transaminase